ncbi:MAG: hypothetical protein V3V00_07950 [Saprospiraceae bacterium]
MKKILLVAFFSTFLFGCNLNPNKEERLQKLELEIQKANEKINELEKRVEAFDKQLISK